MSYRIEKLGLKNLVMARKLLVEGLSRSAHFWDKSLENLAKYHQEINEESLGFGLFLNKNYAGLLS